MKNTGKLKQNICNTGIARMAREQNYRILVVMRKNREGKQKIYGDIL